MQDSRTTIWTAAAAVGGLLAGVAAVLGLFMAKPETISIFIPVQVLREAVATGDALNERPDASAADGAGSAGSEATPAPSAFEAEETASGVSTSEGPSPRQELGGGVSATLMSLADTPLRYVATLRFENLASEPRGVAIRHDGPSRGDLVLSDGRGGSCPFAANGEGWGTLNTQPEVTPDYQIGPAEFRTVQAQGSAQHTIFFNKGRCDTRISGNQGLSISGALVLLEGDDRRIAPIHFENVALRQAN